MISSNYDIHLRATESKIYYDLIENELEKYASIYTNIN